MSFYFLSIVDLNKDLYKKYNGQNIKDKKVWFNIIIIRNIIKILTFIYFIYHIYFHILIFITFYLFYMYF